MLLGENEKFLMVMALALVLLPLDPDELVGALVDAVDGIELLPDEQAARAMAIPKTVTIARFLVCDHPFRVERCLVVCVCASSVIAQSSEPPPPRMN